MAGGGRTEIGDGGWRVARTLAEGWRLAGGGRKAVGGGRTDWSRSLDLADKI